MTIWLRYYYRLDNKKFQSLLRGPSSSYISYYCDVMVLINNKQSLQHRSANIANVFQYFLDIYKQDVYCWTKNGYSVSSSSRAIDRTFTQNHTQHRFLQNNHHHNCITVDMEK